MVRFRLGTEQGPGTPKTVKPGTAGSERKAMAHESDEQIAGRGKGISRKRSYGLQLSNDRSRARCRLIPVNSKAASGGAA